MRLHVSCCYNLLVTAFFRSSGMPSSVFDQSYETVIHQEEWQFHI